MKKPVVITLLIVLTLLSPVLYLVYSFTMNGPIPNEEFEQNLPDIVSNLEYQIEGKGDETLVLIHGYPDSLEMWDKQVEYLKDYYTVVRFTLPGFELNDNGARPHYDMQQIRTIIDHFIEGLGKGKVTVLAHDWGAVFAFKYLEKNDLVDRVVLFDIGSFGKEERPKINVKYTFALAVAWTLPESLGEKLTRYTAADILHIEDVDPHKTIDDLRADPRMTYPYWHLWKSVLSKNLPKSLEVEEYGTPFLFIYGEDKKVWFHADSWVEKVKSMKKGQVESVPGGHWFMHSQPEVANQKVHRWLQSN
ncbi:Pimeloyl-ACP methyl ester carboxylesterase [Ferrimonas sediminum]|uniref:Pimeloyl-ACP methyl ester carboxylesterase n=1 Tax=Ferrimonas sediminum TaxID=718193 RepID=A0A1G8WMD7_9GAMM|nr:alpha/beta hydrolase [Ferrimonas sediminum]SDJ79558.1 Pimeloyl-ACP methyl ester carboxylesterase [Ferrimonas sediminum]